MKKTKLVKETLEENNKVLYLILGGIAKSESQKRLLNNQILLNENAIRIL
jgi:hypothetical protein